MRSVGEYVSDKKGNDSGKKLVQSFFKELQSLDYELLNASRSEPAVAGPEARKHLDATIQALDDLLAALPVDILDKARKVLEVIDSSREKGDDVDNIDLNELNRLQQLVAP